MGHDIPSAYIDTLVGSGHTLCIHRSCIHRYVRTSLSTCARIYVCAHVSHAHKHTHARLYVSKTPPPQAERKRLSGGEKELAEAVEIPVRVTPYGPAFHYVPILRLSVCACLLCVCVLV